MTIKKRGKEGICSSQFQLGKKTHCYTFNGKNGQPLITDKRIAREKEVELRKELRTGLFIRSSSVQNFTKFFNTVYMEFSQAHKSPKAQMFDEYYGGLLKTEFGLTTFSHITPRLIERFLDRLTKTDTQYGKPFSPVTIRMVFNRLTQIFDMAIDEKAATENPCKRVHKSILKGLPSWTPRQRWLNKYDEDEEAKLFANLDANIQTICTLILQLGLRPPREVLRLQKAHANLSDEQKMVKWERQDHILPARSIFVVGKAGSTRVLPLNNIAFRVLETLCSDLATGKWLFVNKNGVPPESFKKGFSAGCSRAGITDLRSYDLRHSFSTRLLDRGVHQYVISELMGHSQPFGNESRITPGYAHVTWETKRQAVESLEYDAPILSVFGSKSDRSRANETENEQISGRRVGI